MLVCTNGHDRCYLGPSKNCPYCEKGKRMAKSITPEQLAACGTEHGHQCALFCWAATIAAQGTGKGWALCDQLRLMFAIPNGGLRSKATAGRLKAEGVKAGVPDIMVPVARDLMSDQFHEYTLYHGLFIEMKRPKSVGKRKGREQDNQSDFAKALEAQGYKCVVAYGWEQARDAILNYLQGNS